MSIENDVITTTETAAARASRAHSPRAFESDAFEWNLGRVPARCEIGGQSSPHPGRCCAIFVVHGMGEQQWTETAAGLRVGFENALEAIEAWQQAHRSGAPADVRKLMPPPFVFDGFWGDYADLERTFPEDWRRFNERERRFFSRLWQLRTMSLFATLWWLIRQQLRLLSPGVVRDVGLAQWLLYWPLQVLWFGAFAYLAVRHPRILTRVVADVRLYASPRGVAERAIVQRIDYRVGEKFLQTIGLDWEFRALPRARHIRAGHERFTFEHVIWVAHSLGTVISYNVLSDLFHRAAHLERHGDDEQQLGVKVFRKSLLRFVTLGSPLNKFAYLFPRAIRPWPEGSRQHLVASGEQQDESRRRQALESREWWINFYHVLDPVSAPLTHKLICGTKPPFNFHADWANPAALIPGVAHLSYWRDVDTLRFILSRLYGRLALPDRSHVPHSPAALRVYSALGYLTWVATVVAATWAFLRVVPRLGTLASDFLQKWLL
jgi:hypothetical protein